MTTITVPRSVREGGKVRVRESPQEVELGIEECRKQRRQILILHEYKNPHDMWTSELRIRWSLIQAVE